VARKYAVLEVREIREERQCSLQEATKLHVVSTLLDEIEAATTTKQLKAQLLTYIQWKEGVE